MIDFAHITVETNALRGTHRPQAQPRCRGEQIVRYRVEAYVVGSFEFYMGYVIKNRKLLCLDAGHFHPTETLADKISSVLQFVSELLLHVSRGVRWDSDQVVLLNDATRVTMAELVRGDFFTRTHIQTAAARRQGFRDARGLVRAERHRSEGRISFAQQRG